MAIPLALHHVSLNVVDLERSLAFYTGVLGLERIARPPLRVDGAWLGIGDAQLHLIVFADDQHDVGVPPGQINPAAPHLALRVHEYGATVGHLRAAGLSIIEAGADRGQCWVQDPDGYVIEFIATA